MLICLALKAAAKFGVVATTITPCACAFLLLPLYPMDDHLLPYPSFQWNSPHFYILLPHLFDLIWSYVACFSEFVESFRLAVFPLCIKEFGIDVNRYQFWKTGEQLDWLVISLWLAIYIWIQERLWYGCFSWTHTWNNIRVKVMIAMGIFIYALGG